MSKKVDFYWTGHPFVDAGLVAILLISGKNNPTDLNEEDIKEAIDFASHLYARDNWVNYLHGMIFPNNGILMTNPSMKKNRIPQNIANRLWNLYLNIFRIPATEKRCVTCGRGTPVNDTKYFSYVGSSGIFRSIFPLLGTGDVTNYFHSANPRGAEICLYCIFLVQFMPIVSYRLPRVLVVHAYPYEVMLELHREAFSDVLKSKLASQAMDFKRPENFLFKLVGDITKRIERDGFWENVSLNLYYFICNNQNQDLDVIHIPNPVLRFVAYASGVDEIGWKKIVSMGWKRQPSNEEEFKKFEKNERNEVYQKLLNYESILQYFYNLKERKVNTSWKLLTLYCREVLGLNRDALEFIKDIGDRIVETLEKLPDHKLGDEIRSLERAQKLYEFENFFIRVEKLRQNLGKEKPLMTFDEFAKILTSYGEDVQISWRTVKNLLLFRIYEKLHERLLKSAESVGEAAVDEAIEELAIYGGGEE